MYRCLLNITLAWNTWATRARIPSRGIGVFFVRGTAIILMVLTATAFALAWPEPYGHYESYFNYIGNYPNNTTTAWDTEVQGLAHDENHWFITQDIRIWKIPVEMDLALVEDNPPVVTKHIDDTPLRGDGYDHFGDPDYYEYDGTGYLIVPVEDDGLHHPAIAVFLASNLQYIDYERLPQPPSPSNINQAAWAAVDNAGHIYSSDTDDSHYTEYELVWHAIKTAGVVLLERVADHPFLDENGAEIFFHPVQGGEFSDSGKLLYISAGLHDVEANDGINVFDTLTNRRVAYSSYSQHPFYFHWDYTYHEPEGLTIWDLDGRGAPHIEGQLHVLAQDWEVIDNDVYMHHFSRWLFVDGDYSGTLEEGSPEHPYKQVGSAYNEIWNGGGLMIGPGTYPETLTMDKQIQLRLDSQSGSAIIGE